MNCHREINFVGSERCITQTATLSKCSPCIYDPALRKLKCSSSVQINILKQFQQLEIYFLKGSICNISQQIRRTDMRIVKEDRFGVINEVQCFKIDAIEHLCNTFTPNYHTYCSREEV